MTLEKKIENAVKHLEHVAGGFLIGVSFYFLGSVADASEVHQVFIRFAMFACLFLLGLSYLGE